MTNGLPIAVSACATGLIGLAVLVGLAAPASALAATVTVTSPFVVNTVDGPGGVPIEGAGFSPGSTRKISTDGNLAAQAQSDAPGALHFVLRTPVGVVRAHQTVQLTVTDPAGVAAQTSYEAVVQSVVIPRHTKAGRPATFRAYGFPGPYPFSSSGSSMAWAVTRPRWASATVPAG